MSTSKYIYEKEKKSNNIIGRYHSLINGTTIILFLILYLPLIYFI